MTAICRNGCKTEEGWPANFKTERVTLQQWEVAPDGYWVAADGEEHAIAAERDTMWICTKCGTEAYHVDEKTVEIIRIINNLGYTGPDVISAIHAAMQGNYLKDKNERSADSLAEEIVRYTIPAPVSSVTIEYRDDGTRHRMLIAEADDPTGLRYGFVDEDIFFYGLTPSFVINACNKQVVLESEWKIVEYHGLASPVEYASNYVVEQEYGNGNIPTCGSNKCGEFKTYRNGKTACDFFVR